MKGAFVGEKNFDFISVFVLWSDNTYPTPDLKNFIITISSLVPV
jgi:hypothetical protein